MSRADRPRRPWSDWMGAAFYAALLAQTFRGDWRLALLALPLQLQNLMLLAAFLIRPPARASARPLAAKIVAFADTILVIAFLDIAARWAPAWIAPTRNMPVAAAGLLLYTLGVLLSLPAVWELRRAFSIVPAARELVVSGPYRWARHPIYAAYVVEFTGLFMSRMTLPFGLVLLAYLALMRMRVRFEEQILVATFPEYEQYRRRVGAFAPALRLPARRAATATAAADAPSGRAVRWP